jgi:tetratricopeptide (TPR) repeat protein
MISFAAPTRARRVVFVLALLASLHSAPARADDAKSLYRRGSSEYALGHYETAATLFEQSFAQSNEPALLFNAAQAHRLAGHKGRALDLYQSYLRVAGQDAARRFEIEERIATLKEELAHPPLNHGLSEPGALSAAAAPDRPLYKRPWLWATVGGVVVAVGLGVGLGVGLTRDRAPHATIGSLPLN